MTTACAITQCIFLGRIMPLAERYTHCIAATLIPSATDISDLNDQRHSLTSTRFRAPQGDYHLRVVFDALRWLIRTCAGRRLVPHNFARWSIVSRRM
jgi:hypothetical protein